MLLVQLMLLVDLRIPCFLGAVSTVSLKVDVVLQLLKLSFQINLGESSF